MSHAVSAPAWQAMQAMKAKAKELGVEGVGVVYFFMSDDLSEALVYECTFGASERGYIEGKPGEYGRDYRGTAYEKVAYAISTHQDSGESDIPPKLGQVDYRGALFAPEHEGNPPRWLLAFSGGSAAQDVEIVKAGLLALGYAA